MGDSDKTRPGVDLERPPSPPLNPSFSALKIEISQCPLIFLGRGYLPVGANTGRLERT